jgi:hypothetical protein
MIFGTMVTPITTARTGNKLSAIPPIKVPRVVANAAKSNVGIVIEDVDKNVG